MREGWNCPRCGKAHGPHVDTCPEPQQAAPPMWPVWPWEQPYTPYQEPRTDWPSYYRPIPTITIGGTFLVPNDVRYDLIN